MLEIESLASLGRLATLSHIWVEKSQILEVVDFPIFSLERESLSTVVLIQSNQFHSK